MCAPRIRCGLRQIPHLLTVFRLLASPVLAWLIVESRFREALALLVLAGVTDWLDGFAARRLGVTGHLGAILDPLADKVLLVTLFVVLTTARLIPWPLLILVIGRDLVIVAGAFLLRLFRGAREFAPSLLGKISTFFQIMLVFHVLLFAVFPNELFSLLKDAALALTAIFTALSGLDYLRTGRRMAQSRGAPSR